jgi:hypothetical protein
MINTSIQSLIFGILKEWLEEVFPHQRKRQEYDNHNLDTVA